MRRRKKLVAALLVLAVIVGWPVAAHYRAKNKVAAYRRQLLAQGEKMSVSELTPLLPAGKDNGADALISAIWQAGFFTNYTPTMRPVVPGRALVAWRQSILPTSDSTNVWPGLKEDLERKSAALDAMCAALEKPAIAFNLDYSQGFHVLLPHLPQLKGAAQLLSAATMLELHKGGVTNAVWNLRALTALAARYQDEPLMISSLVRIAIAAIAMSAAWETLQSPDLTDEQLAALQADWEGVDVLPQFEAALAMERAMTGPAFAECRKSPRAVLAMTRPGGASSGLAELAELGKAVLDHPGEGLKEIARRYPGYWAWKGWWSYEDELVQLQFLQADLAAVREVKNEKCFAPALTRCDQAHEAIRKAHPKAGSWLGDPGPAYRRYLTRLRTIEIQRRLLVTAIALKRRQLRHGNLPESLTALAPEFFREPPRDPIDGQPQRYRLQPNGGFALYSVGEDGVDNGGDPSPPSDSSATTRPNWLNGRDVVWPQPASAAELELYFQKQAAEKLAAKPITPQQLRERYGISAAGASTSSSNPAPTTNR